MGNPLLLAWLQLAGRSDRPVPRGEITPEARALAQEESADPAGGVLLVLRRMRYPIIAVVLIFSVSALGLTLIPGVDGQGRPTRLSFFDALYVVSYTATTIGFGETPHAFTIAQRMWVTVVIFMSVIGWAYGLGSLIALTQDRSFRRALTRRRVSRKVTHLVEPFHIIVGYGESTKRIARALDNLGRRVVVVESNEARASIVDLDAYRADVPTVLGNARETRNLVLAGLAHPACEGVIAMSGDDQTNLDVAMTTALLRPGLPVIARASSRAMAERMEAFDVWHVVNALDRFGNHLRILARSPSAYRLMTWLTGAPGTPLPQRRRPVPRGRWVVAGTGRFATEMVKDLRDEGVEVTVLSERPGAEEADELTGAGLEAAVAFVAAANDDTTNLWLLDSARRVNPHLYTVALERRPSNVPLFDALDVSFGMTPTEIVGEEVMARLANPALMRFLPYVPRMGEAWSAAMVERLVSCCGSGTPELWLVALTADSAPALVPWLEAGGLTLGDLMRSPVDRADRLAAVPLALIRDGHDEPGPADDEVLAVGDSLLLAATTPARRALDATLSHEPTAAYVVDGRFVPSSWVWRYLTRAR